jgi:UDP-2,3-diacylglucosamine pyrophosphatase LpxH
MHSKKRAVDLVVISDVHLGTYGCHAKELNKYLKSIKPTKLIINGDFIDFWQFSKWYWPDSHSKVLKRILKLLTDGTEIYYLTGNHDEKLRKFTDMHLGNFHLLDKLVLDLNGHKAWFFHGDVFDITMRNSKSLVKLGAWSYDTLIILNRVVNYISEKLGRGKISLSKKIKNGVKSAVSYIGNFEDTVMSIADEKGYDFVLCGHIHQPVIKKYKNLLYLNSGDWIENLTALEWHCNEWNIYKYEEPTTEQNEVEDLETNLPDIETILQMVMN